MNIDFDRLKYSLTGEYEEVKLEKELKDKTKEIERLQNIIKEVREYMKSIEHEPDADMYLELGQYIEYKHILEILDKGE